MKHTIHIACLLVSLVPSTLCAGTRDKSSDGSTDDSENDYERKRKRSACSPGWRVTAGFMHRSLGDFDWLTGTNSIPGMLTLGPGTTSDGLAAIGPADAPANRTYNDGYVRLDPLNSTGRTSDWGYNEASQATSTGTGHILSFHGGNTTSSTFSEPTSEYAFGGWARELDGNAPYVEFAYMNPWRDNWCFGFQGSFSFLSTDASRTHSTFTASRSRTDFLTIFTDVYQLGETNPPPAPYTGTPQGPAIPNIPFSRTPNTIAAGGETVSAFNSISTDYDLNLSAISLGPVIEFCHGPWAVTASTGLTVNFADWEVNQRETLFVARPGVAPVAQNTFNHRDDHTEVLAGFFIQAAASREIGHFWSLQLIGRYDWVQDFNLAAGPSTGSVDLNGWSLGVAAGFKF